MATSISLVTAALFFLFFLRRDWLSYSSIGYSNRTPYLYCMVMEVVAIVTLIFLALADVAWKILS